MNYVKGILLYIIAFIALAVGAMVFASCATPNAAKQKKHYDKFIYYGGKIDTVTRTIPVEVLVKGKDGKDSLIYIDVPVKCPEAQIEYKDRWHIRRMDKQERDSLKQVERMLKINAKNAERLAEIQRKNYHKLAEELTKQEKEKTKQARHENKNNNWLWIVLAAVAAFVFIIIRFK
jgi:phosphate/sulfate permease